MLKHRDFYHQRIRYSFNWNINHHKEKLSQIATNRKEFIKLGKYFKSIYEGNIPNNLFNNEMFPRVSRFKIVGLKSAFINTYSKKLIRTGRVLRFGFNSKLPKYAQNVFDTYKKNNINGIPGHEPILKNILIKDKDSVAIEVPIWKKKDDEYLTGHIDLIQFEKNVVKVIDYKPEGNFLISLPQVALYGILMKRIFNIREIKCVSFNKNEVWEYNPEVLITDVKKYLISQRINGRTWEKYIE